MSQRNTPRTDLPPDAIDELYDLINVQHKLFLLQNDFIDFFESKDFPSGMETFDTSKYFNFVGGNSGRVTRNSFREGYEKEIVQLQEELNLLHERIDLEDTIMNEIEKSAQIEQSNALYGDDGNPLGANLYLSILQIRRLGYKIDPDVRLTIIIEFGEITLSVEPVYYVSGFALWPNERFVLPVYNPKTNAVFSVYLVSKEDQLSFLGGFEVNFASLQDQTIHKRYYKVYNQNKVVCEVLMNLLYIHNYSDYENSKRERRRQTHLTTSKRNTYLIQVLEEKLQRLTQLRGYQLFEELFSKDVELPSLISPKTIASPRFNVKTDHTENSDFISEGPSIYDEDNQIRVFLTSADEEKILFQRYIGDQDSPNASDIIDSSTSKFDFPLTSSPDYMKMSMFDMASSDLEYMRPPSSTHKRSKTLHNRPLSTKHNRKRTIDGGFDFNNDGASLLGFSSISEIEHPFSSNEKLPYSSNSLKPPPLYQLNISEIRSAKSSKQPTSKGPSRSQQRFPSIVAEESTVVMKSDHRRDNPSSHFDRPPVQINKEKFFEDAFLIGLAELMKRHNAK